MGKSTLARRYVDDRPLTLLVEIDAIRVSIGGWQRHDETKLLARSLALAMAEAHLGAGHDVIVPQYLGRTEFITTLGEAARRAGAEFVEALVLADEDAVAHRFRARRAELLEDGHLHPETDIADQDIGPAVAEACAALRRIAEERPWTYGLRMDDGVETARRALEAAVAEARRTPPTVGR